MHKTAQTVQSMLQPCQLYSELNHIRCIMLLHFHGKEHGKATNPAYTDSDSNQATLCRARVDHIEANMVERRGPTGQ